MKRIILFPFVFIFIMACTTKKINYPETRKSIVKESYFGTEVPDPYRWLEDDQSEETAQWVKAQNQLTFNYLDQLPNHKKIMDRFTELWDYPTKNVPKKKAGKYFFFANDGTQNQDILYTTTDLREKAEVLLNPNEFSKDGTIALSKIGISHDGKYLGYLVAESGSDWNEIFVMDVESRKLLPDHLKWIKFSRLSWYKDGFFYSAYNKPEKGDELSASNKFQKVYYHQLGQNQDDDQIIYGEPENETQLYDASVTHDNRFLFIGIRGKLSGNALVFKNLKKKDRKFTSIVKDYNHEFIPIGNIDDNIYVLTNYNAPKYKLIKINANRIDEKYWEDVIPETENVLTMVKIYAHRFVVEYMVNACSKVEIYNLNGSLENEIVLPGMGTVSSFKGGLNDNAAFYNYQSFDTPEEIYKYNFITKKSSLFFKPEVKMCKEELEVDQVFYKSKDSTTISMFLFHKKGIKLNRNNPVLLYGYGGFNISRTPEFEKAWLLFVEQGGIFAMANLRGGGEYGEKWHQDGIKMNKQHVFDDFIAAAEYLIDQGVTCPDKLAIYGRSNGGLLIGAVVNQRPDLFKVALPTVGVMDMLRYHKFTIGWSWASDYGTSEDSKEMFEYLYRYSPYHNIVEGTKYPAILASTGDHDDRVVPAHTFKYIARMQELNKGSLPTFVRIDCNAGHGSGKPVSKLVDEWADKWTFLFYHLGIKM